MDSTSQATAQKKATVLIVDDEPNDLQLLAQVLEANHFAIRVVPSGAMALTSAKLDPPDVILLKVYLPDMTGCEVCQELKASAWTRDVPVIFTGALDTAVDKVRAFTAGGADYITKPFQPEEVLIRIDNQLEIRQAREELRKLRRVVEQSGSSIIITDVHGNIEYVNPKFTRVTGYTFDEVRGKNPRILKSGLMEPAVYRELWETIRAGKEWCGEFQNRKKNGEIFWEVGSVSPIFDEHGAITHFLAVKEDITSRKRVEESLRQANEDMARWIRELKHYNREITLLNSLSDKLQMCQTAAEAYRVIEKTAAQLFPESSGALYIAHTDPADMGTLGLVCRWGDHEFIPTLSQCHCEISRGKRFHISSSFSHKMGEMTCLRAEGVPEQSSYLCVPLISEGKAFGILRFIGKLSGPQEAHEHWFGLALMISDHLSLALANLHLRERLREQSIRDPLTGLYNRRFLNETLSREITRALQHRRPISVIMADIDHFKRFNDTYGHDAGDMLLKSVANYLQQHIRNTDIACRYGGEEFVLILPEASVSEASERANSLREGIQTLQTFYHGNPLELVTISLGVAGFPDHGDHGEAVLKAADVALYEAKSSGRNRVCVAGRSLTTQVRPFLRSREESMGREGNVE